MGVKSFLFFGPEKSSKEGLEVATPENLKWKKYIRQSENANGRPLEPLWGSKKLKVSTKRTLRPTNLPFWFGEKSSWCRSEKKRKVQKVFHFWSGEKSSWCKQEHHKDFSPRPKCHVYWSQRPFGANFYLFRAPQRL